MRSQRLMAIYVVFLACYLVVQLRATDEQIDEQTAKITSHLSSNTARVAEQIYLELVVTAPAGCQVTFPASASKLGDFEVVAQSDRFDIPSVKDVSERIWTRELTLESLLTGDLQVPALEVQVTGTNINQRLSTERVSIQVLSVLKDGEQPNAFRDIESVMDVKVPEISSRRWLWWLLGALGSGSLALAIFGAIRHRGPHLTPASWAMREIERLDAATPDLARDAVAVLQSLTAILRDYLELQFDVSAQVQTTEELLEFVQAERLLSEGDTKCLSTLLDTADQVKFAGLRPSQSELAMVLVEVKRLIERTACDVRINRHATNTVEGN